MKMLNAAEKDKFCIMNAKVLAILREEMYYIM